MSRQRKKFLKSQCLPAFEHITTTATARPAKKALTAQNVSSLDVLALLALDVIPPVTVLQGLLLKKYGRNYETYVTFSCSDKNSFLHRSAARPKVANAG